jgi:plastocyanin
VSRRAACLLLPLVFAAASPAAAKIIHVNVQGIAFSPATVSAQVGDTIEWTNKDFVLHSATARDRSWEVNLPPNKTGRMVMKKPGTIAYYCRLHPNMTGTIKVSAK